MVVNGSSTTVLEPTLPLSQNLVIDSPQPRKTASDIIVGYATPADAEAIAKIGADTFTATFGYSVSVQDLADFLDATYTADAAEADINNPTIATFTARDVASGKVLGFVQLVRSISEPCVPGDPVTHAELRRLYVDTTAHGRGIGSKLIAAVEARAREEGFRQLWLTVWENNVSAQRLYLRLAYERVGEVEFVTGTCIQTDYVLSKSL
jgi:ribosomal protein S18 acetylase RimI-like enzyme